MKKRILFLLFAVLLTALFTFPVYAAQTVTLPDDNMTLQVPDDFTILQRETLPEMKGLLAEYGTSLTETDVKLKSGNYRFYAVSNLMRCTLFLSGQTDSVSRSIGDLITYPDPETAKSLLLGKNLPKNAVVKELEHNGALFYRVDFGVTEGIGRIAYFTVINNTAYTLCVVDNNGTISPNTNALIDTTFNSWEYTIEAEQQRIQSFRENVTSAVYLICQIVAIIGLVFLIRMAIRSVQKHRMEKDRQKNLPKRPRR
ncbi:MAG: hypothetical protein IKU10_02500 [Clostridia bacterium]|nr:hypothetical protein [Clostridia bacterium]